MTGKILEVFLWGAGVFYLTRSPVEHAPKEKVLKLDREYLNNVVNILDLTELYTFKGKCYTTVNLHVLDSSFKVGS